MEIKNNTRENGSSTKKKNKPLYVEMGKRLRILRTGLNYTQEQMSEILEMSTAYYGKVERGIYGLSLEKLVLANKKLDMDINYLLTGSRRGEIALDKIIDECPKNKRYDMEQLIKYAINLAKESE
mgnify:CR=1 FL=1